MHRQPNSPRRPDVREADERLRWSALASVWAHLLLFIVFWSAPPPVDPDRKAPPKPPEEPIVVVRVEPPDRTDLARPEPVPTPADDRTGAATDPARDATPMDEPPEPRDPREAEAREREEERRRPEREPEPPEPSKPLARAPERTPPEPDPRRKPPPTTAPDEVTPPPPAPAPPPAEEQVKTFVRTDDKTADLEAPDETDVISSGHHVATERKRAQVFDPLRGDSVASPSTPSPSVRQQLDGAQADVRGSPVTDPAETHTPTRAGGSGHAGAAVAAGAPLPGEAQREGGEAAAAAAAAAAGASTPPGDASAERLDVPPAPMGELPTASKGTPSWWEPLAVRVELEAPDPADRDQLTTPADRMRVAAVERPGTAEDLGGTDRPETVEDAPAPGVKGEAEIDPDPGQTARADALVEPVDAVREALGWGRLDRATIQPRPGSAPAPNSVASLLGSSQTVLDDPEDEVVLVATEGTPLGIYTEQIYGVLQTRWYDLDLDIEQKALGVQGEVTVVFRVQRNGRVTDLKVKKSSGIYNLDRMAVEAVPPHLPRLPREVEGPFVVQHVTFTYRNPFIASAGAP